MPDWPVCGRIPGCPGSRVDNVDGCLEHLEDAELDEFLAGLHAGADLDVRGTTLSVDLVGRITRAMQEDERVVFGGARFDHAILGDIDLAGARFNGPAAFRSALFDGTATFTGAEFGEDATFNGARFSGVVEFNFAAFVSATFDRAIFEAETLFDGVFFREHASFRSARFDKTSRFQLLVKSLDFNDTDFTGAVDFEAETSSIDCSGTRFADGATLAVRYGEIVMEGTLFGAPSAIRKGSTIGEPGEPWDWLDELRAPDRGDAPQLLSLRDVNVANLALVDVNLSRCVFAGAHRLDQLRIEGHCKFGTPPRGWRWTRRQILAEEAEWRGWVPEEEIYDVGQARQAAWLATIYRSLRKSFEDGKNEAGAGDFYYGEMEMRRHSPETRRAERWILWWYWLLSGYGQRGGRALAALLALIATVAMLLGIWGQPPAEAVQIALGAVALRDAGTKLTEAGQWTVMAARVLGPVLLALAVLAVRARVKR